MFPGRLPSLVAIVRSFDVEQFASVRLSVTSSPGDIAEPFIHNIHLPILPRLAQLINMASLRRPSVAFPPNKPVQQSQRPQPGLTIPKDDGKRNARKSKVGDAIKKRMSMR